MKIRTYQSGDAAIQAAIYNEAAAHFPKFKPATVEEIDRRCQAADFDAGSRFYAEVDGQAVGYATFSANGRVSYPWCRQGFEYAAESLFQSVLGAMASRSMRVAFAAYRGDWEYPKNFFIAHRFPLKHEMINYILEPIDLPTTPLSRSSPLTPLRPTDIRPLFRMGKLIVRAETEAELERHLFQNPYFPPEAVFVSRNRDDQMPRAVAVFIGNPEYADPTKIDANMPCFRLGAFGTEGMQVKRVHGLFSFMTPDQPNISTIALDLIGQAVIKFDRFGGGPLAAQVPSDATHLERFYSRYFRRQGSFPIFERVL